MTCIVGLEFNGKVIIGGDVQGTAWNSKVIHTQPKVFEKSGVAFGYTTSYRFGQVLEHGLKNPVVPEDADEVYRWLITVLVPDIAASLKAAAVEGGGNCLIGIKGQLWELQNDFSVLRSTLGYRSVGSGTEYAHGSIFQSLKMMTPTTQDAAEKVVRDAILCAGTFCPSVGTESELIYV